MSRIPKTLTALVGLALLIGAPAAFGQGVDQTTNSPVGSATEPGSQLLYIADTGANLREAVGAANLFKYSETIAKANQFFNGDPLPENPFGIGGSRTVYGQTGAFDPELINRNFLSITNTHPTQAVTVHFRYFNDECLDLLDFLVVLTCNDTLIFDPFNFVIPQTPFMTQTRIFGPTDQQGILSPIPARMFGSGRFLIFATAAGTTTDYTNDVANLRFPKEFDTALGVDPAHHCDNLQDLTDFGTVAGLSPNNLHVFNSSAIVYNHLVGSFTTAIPFGDKFQAYGVSAWTRPAVDLAALTMGPMGVGDTGDGPPAATEWQIITGNEIVPDSGQQNSLAANTIYLRSDVHGGENQSPQFVYYGAQAMTSLWGAAPEDQLVHFLSMVDDYNGSRHASDNPVAGFVDRAYNLNGAETNYTLQLYDNDENLFSFEGPEPPPNISPLPPDVPTTELDLIVDCMRAWVISVSNATSIDDFQISDLALIAQEAMDHVNKPSPPLFDASKGWIRFVRDNLEGGTNAPRESNAAGNNSYVTVGIQVVKAGGFGAAWWLPTVSYDPCVSELGVPDAVCLTP
jgi:hypothetical protein